MVDFLLHTLETTDFHAVQTVVCTGLAKLMLAGMLSDERVRRIRSKANCADERL